MNADSIIGTSEQNIGYNLYVYVENNPVRYYDSEGEFLLEIGAGLAKAAEVAIAGIGLGISYYAAKKATKALADVITNLPELPRYEPKKKEDTKKKDNGPTYIYRYNGTNPRNLKPRESDLISNTGVSFSTVPVPGAAETTIEEINATGVLYAVKDGRSHVSVYPIGGTMKQWYYEGTSSIWTQTLKSVVRKWDGVFK